jgi:hypothetical protein
VLFAHNSDKYIEYPNFTTQTSQLARYDAGANALVPLGATQHAVAELSGTRSRSGGRRVVLHRDGAAQAGVSKVTNLDDDGNEGGGLSTSNASTGRHISGAGVSTCASWMPPG